MEMKILEEIGLTPGEAKVYIALLSLGTASTGPIAKESGVSRSKLYIILDNLEKKGLAAHVEENGVMRFQAAEPEKISDYLRQKQEKIRSLEKRLKHVLPGFESYRGLSAASQKVAVYQGMKGMATVHEHIYLKLKKGGEYVYIGIPKSQPPKMHAYWKKDHSRRAKTGIACRLLFNRDVEPEVLANRNSYRGCTARYMPAGIKTLSSFLIYRDTVGIIIPGEKPVTIEITSREIAESFMVYFKEFWKLSRPFRRGKVRVRKA